MLFGSLVWQIYVVGGQPKPYEGAPNDSSYLHTIEYPTTWWNFPPTFLMWRRLPSFLTISTSHGMGIHKNHCQCEVIWQRSNIGDPFSQIFMWMFHNPCFLLESMCLFDNMTWHDKTNKCYNKNCIDNVRGWRGFGGRKSLYLEAW